MKGFRIALVRAVCRAARAALRALGRAGSSLPGTLALRLCPDILPRLSVGTQTILVTGTNGKTTVCALLRHMAERRGAAVISNADGANLLGGIAAAFVCRPLRGAPPKLAIIECDEGTLPRAAALLRPRVVVVTNLFRDQLDRYGEIMHTRAALRAGIDAAPEAILCLNADCSLTASLAWETQNRALFFGLDTAAGGAASVSDAPRCLACGGAYEYLSRSFAHLGNWYCPACGRKRPEPDVAVTQRAPEGTVTAAVFGRELSFRAALDADYNLYNAAAALTAAGALGWDRELAAASLADAAVPFGRGETLRVGKSAVRLFLAKNPAGMDRLLEQLAGEGEAFTPLFCLNDNYADGRDVSWIWDCDFEGFVRRSGVRRAAVWGTRRRDMLLRLWYACADEDALSLAEYASLKALRRDIASSSEPVCIIANYTAMLALRRALTGRSIGRVKWN